MTTGLEGLSDPEVQFALERAVKDERKSTAAVLRCLIEFERRRLEFKQPYGSTFDYCTKGLGYSEPAALKRIQAARAAASYPVILDLVESKEVNLAAVAVLRPHLSVENHLELLRKAATMTTRQLEFFVAGLSPREHRRDSIRALKLAPAPVSEPGTVAATAAWPAAATAVGAPAASSAVSTVESPLPLLAQVRLPEGAQPLSAELARVFFTADRQTVEGIDRACELLRCGRRNLGPVMARAIEALLNEIDPDRKYGRGEAKGSVGERAEPATPSAPKNLLRGEARKSSRYIPAHVRQEVWQRDEGRCTYVDSENRRCCARAAMEFDHIVPLAAGGPSDDPANLRLRCRLHNMAAARDWFGAEVVDRAIEEWRQRRAEDGRSPP